MGENCAHIAFSRKPLYEYLNYAGSIGYHAVLSELVEPYKCLFFIYRHWASC